MQHQLTQKQETNNNCIQRTPTPKQSSHPNKLPSKHKQLRVATNIDKCFLTIDLHGIYCYLTYCKDSKGLYFISMTINLYLYLYLFFMLLLKWMSMLEYMSSYIHIIVDIFSNTFWNVWAGWGWGWEGGFGRWRYWGGVGFSGWDNIYHNYYSFIFILLLLPASILYIIQTSK